MHKRILVILGVWALVGCGLKGFAAEAPATPKQIAEWVQQLGADDFDAREGAEQKLIKAGAVALPELQKAAQSSDPEIRNRSARIAEILKWAIVPKITDLPSILPPDNLFFIGTPGAKELVTRIRKETALGRLYDRPDLAPLIKALRSAFIREARIPDNLSRMIDQWFDRFGGPAGFAFLRYDREQKRYGDREQMAFFLGINDPKPNAAMADFREAFPLYGETAQQAYRGVSCTFQQSEYRNEGLALVKNLIVRSTGKTPMLNTIDALVDDKQADLASSDTYKEARSKVSGKPLATLFFNMNAMFGTMFRGNRDLTFAQALGFREWPYGIVTLDIQDGLFVEQAFCKVDGERRGLAKLFSLKPVSGRMAALCPPDALLFVTIPVDGKSLFKTIITMTDTIDPRDSQQFRDELAKLDKQLDIQVMDSLVNALEGEAGLWLMRPKDLKEVPDTCIVLETRDANAAKTAADTLAKLIPHLAGKKDLVGKADYKGRTCYFMKPVEDRDPWEPDLRWSWCADGARILVGHRQEVLQKMVLRFSKQDLKGLDTHADFKRLLATIPENERGGLYYANNCEALKWGYTVGMPLLTAEAPPALKAELAKAPKDPEVLFKDLAGSLLTIRGTPDGVRARAVGSIPTSCFNAAAVPLLLVIPMERRARDARRARMLEMEALEKAKAAKAKAEAEAKAKEAREKKAK